MGDPGSLADQIANLVRARTLPDPQRGGTRHYAADGGRGDSFVGGSTSLGSHAAFGPVPPASEPRLGCGGMILPA
jgi:hypothetical protein